MRKQNEIGRKDLAIVYWERKGETEKQKNKQKQSVSLTVC
jgi:hypothetical protein